VNGQAPSPPGGKCEPGALGDQCQTPGWYLHLHKHDSLFCVCLPLCLSLCKLVCMSICLFINPPPSAKVVESKVLLS
jgi:hypothetical protein